MYNYTLLSNQIQDSLNNYCKFLINDLGMVNKKFIYNMINGIMKSNSTHLTKIGRCLNEDITLKKTVERLSRNLMCFNDIDKLHNNYTAFIMNNIIQNDTPLFFVDESDIAKPNVKDFECLGDVQDGSNEHKWTKGYGLTEIATLINNEPIITQSALWSTADPEFKSKNAYLYDLLEKNINLYQNKGTYIFDRGFDQTNLINFLITNKTEFIIRLKTIRKIFIKNKQYTIEEILNKYKGKIIFKSNRQEKVHKNKLSFVKVNLKGIKQELTLVISYPEYTSQEIAYLITNRKINNAHDVRQIVRDYFKRWRIEEYFKFKKTQFEIEDIRVRSLNALKVMNSLINYTITFISIKNSNIWLKKQIIKISKPIKTIVYFNYYRISMGINIIFKNVIYKTKLYVDSFIRNINYVLSSKNEQRNLFNFEKF